MTRRETYAETSDAVLMAWSAQGDRRAFEVIVMRHGTTALRFARRMVPEAAAAEDIAQEAMVRAWKNAGRFDADRAHFATWLYRIVTNLCIDHGRRSRTVSLPDDFDVVDPAPAADERMDLSQRQHALVSAIRDLPPRQRTAMTLVYGEGLSGAETARVLGLSAKAVERLLARARTLLRERLRPGHGL